RLSSGIGFSKTLLSSLAAALGIKGRVLAKRLRAAAGAGDAARRSLQVSVVGRRTCLRPGGLTRDSQATFLLQSDEAELRYETDGRVVRSEPLRPGRGAHEMVQQVMAVPERTDIVDEYEAVA